MKSLCFLLVVAASVTCSAQEIYFQGFETNISGWDVFGPPFPVRVASGTHGIISKSGSFHAEAPGPLDLDNDGGSAATDWGGYGFTPGCVGTCPAAFPPNGYETKLDIYLDVSGSNPNQKYTEDTRFDYTSAISMPDGSFRRDFFFNGGYYNDTNNDPGSGPRFVFTASNNGGRMGAFPKNPGRNPFVISTSGWYTFVHHFYNNGAGVLAADLSILDASGNVLMTWTLSDPTDIIGTTVGGNRYGWIAAQEFNFLPIDNAELIVLGAQGFSVGYAANLDKGDSIVNITNSGTTPSGNICVNVYAFDPSEEFLSCCSCLVTPNALVSLSVQGDLISNTLSPQTPTSVLIALVSSTPSGGSIAGCDPSQTTTDTIAPGMQAWGTTLHALPGTPATFGLTENDFLPSSLSTGELTHLASFCGFAQSNGSGFGVCKSCRAGGLNGSKK